jgi:hypothetical protein
VTEIIDNFLPKKYTRQFLIFFLMEMFLPMQKSTHILVLQTRQFLIKIKCFQYFTFVVG